MHMRTQALIAYNSDLEPVSTTMQLITPANGDAPSNGNGKTTIAELPAHLAIIGMVCLVGSLVK
jgi:hypothetical protein